MSCATMLFPLTKPGCIGSQQQLCQRILLAAELICSHAKYKSSIGVKELMHFFDATHTSINAIDKAEAESSSPHSITPKTPVRSVGLGLARAKRGNGRPSMKNNSKHATRQALRFTPRKRARGVPTSAPDVASKRARAIPTSAPDIASESAHATSASAARSASATDTAASADIGSKRLKASPLAAANSRPAEGSAFVDAANDSTPAEGNACAEAADDSTPAEANACADAANDSRPAEGNACTGSANDSTAALMADGDSNQAQTVAMPSAADAQCNTEAAARCTPETEGSSGVVSSTDVVQSVPDARVCLKQLLIEYQLAAEARNGADKITIVPADTCSQATRQHQVHTELQPDFTSVLCEQQSLPDGIRHACVVQLSQTPCSSTLLMSLPKDASQLQQLSLQGEYDG